MSHKPKTKNKIKKQTIPQQEVIAYSIGNPRTWVYLFTYLTTRKPTRRELASLIITVLSSFPAWG